MKTLKMSQVKRKDQKEIAALELRHECIACKASFHFKSQLRFHIRGCHFNRVGRLPHADTQDVDQVWYERVGNTDTIVQVKKVSNNIIIIQKVKDLPIQPTEIICKEHEKVIDVREQYPLFGQKGNVAIPCSICQKLYSRRLLSKHFVKSHARLVKKRCEACKITFKTVFNCARHVCTETRINKTLKKS